MDKVNTVWRNEKIEKKEPVLSETGEDGEEMKR